MPRSATSDSVRSQLPGAVALALAGAGLWWGWFAWDTQRSIDPATGSETGPYEVWQVAGCVLSWIVLAWIGVRMLRPLLVALVLPAAFTAAFALTGAGSDDSGLWVVGAVLVALGSFAGTAVLVLLLRRPAAPSRRRAEPAGSAR